MLSSTGTWTDLLYQESCWDDYDDGFGYAVVDTGSWYGYYGSSPVVGDQILTGELTCGEDPEMPIADVFTTSIMEEGDTLTVTLDEAMYLNHDVWINTEDSCTVGWPITHWEDCPVEDSYCTVASVDVVADVVYQVVVQRNCLVDEEGHSSYTLRVDSANFECPSLTCPVPILVTLTGDDMEAAEFTDYAETSGWKIEGELSWD
jgi:hypothetical protein